MTTCTCGKVAKLVSGKEIYPHRRDLYSLSFWKCDDCNSYCGCHKGTIKPLGTLANEELRSWRKKCHAEFDPLWKDYSISRSEAYAWMSKAIGIPVNECHIALFDVKQCTQLLHEIGQAWERHTLPFLLGDKFESWIMLKDFIPFYAQYYTFIKDKSLVPKRIVDELGTGKQDIVLTRKERMIELTISFDVYEDYAEYMKQTHNISY